MAAAGRGAVDLLQESCTPAETDIERCGAPGSSHFPVALSADPSVNAAKIGLSVPGLGRCRVHGV